METTINSTTHHFKSKASHRSSSPGKGHPPNCTRVSVYYARKWPSPANRTDGTGRSGARSRGYNPRCTTTVGMDQRNRSLPDWCTSVASRAVPGPGRSIECQLGARPRRSHDVVPKELSERFPWRNPAGDESSTGMGNVPFSYLFVRFHYLCRKWRWSKKHGINTFRFIY